MSHETIDHLDKYDNLLNILIKEVDIDGKKYYLREDFEKFFVKGNKAAGTRIRKVMQMIRKSAESIRKDIQEYKAEI